MFRSPRSLFRSSHTAIPTLAILLLTAGIGAAQTAMQVAVEEAVIATDIRDRQPIDNLSVVPADVGQVYCWTRITGAEGEIEIEHVWLHEGEEMARVPLHVAGTNWRTWSSKRIVSDWTGEWRVDVVGPDGTVLRSVNFTVE